MKINISGCITSILDFTTTYLISALLEICVVQISFYCYHYEVISHLNCKS